MFSAGVTTRQYECQINADNLTANWKYFGSDGLYHNAFDCIMAARCNAAPLTLANIDTATSTITNTTLG
jgi:hypothetical protein